MRTCQSHGQGAGAGRRVERPGSASRTLPAERNTLAGLALRPGFRLKARSPSIKPSGRGRRHELRQTEFELQGQRCCRPAWTISPVGGPGDEPRAPWRYRPRCRCVSLDRPCRRDPPSAAGLAARPRAVRASGQSTKEDFRPSPCCRCARRAGGTNVAPRLQAP